MHLVSSPSLRDLGSAIVDLGSVTEELGSVTMELGVEARYPGLASMDLRLSANTWAKKIGT